MNIDKVLSLAKINIKDASRKDKLAGNLESILEYVKKISDAPKNNTNYNHTGLQNPAVPDVPDTSSTLTQKLATQNSAKSTRGYIQVDKVL